MAITTVGKNLVAARLVGATLAAIDASTGYLGVGNSSTAFAVGQTDLQGGSKFRKILSGAPGLASNVITLIATFETGEANFAWAEWGSFNHASAGQMFSRKVAAHGTKASGDVWELTVTITIG